MSVTASTQGDAGRTLIRTVLRSGLEALQNDGPSQALPVPGGEDIPQTTPTVPPASKAGKVGKVDALLETLGVSTWKEQAEEELNAVATQLADKATASIVKRLDRDGEIRAGLQQNMRSIRILCWILVIYLFGISPFMFVLLASNRRMRRQLAMLNEKLDLLVRRNG